MTTKTDGTLDEAKIESMHGANNIWLVAANGKGFVFNHLTLVVECPVYFMSKWCDETMGCGMLIKYANISLYWLTICDSMRPGDRPRILWERRKMHVDGVYIHAMGLEIERRDGRLWYPNITIDLERDRRVPEIDMWMLVTPESPGFEDLADAAETES